MHKNTSLELLRTPILCLVQLSKYRECESTDAQNLFLSQKKLLNVILKQAQLHEKMFLSNEMNCFLQCRRQHFMSLSFFAEKVILELNAQNHFFRASKNTNSVFSATKQLMRI